MTLAIFLKVKLTFTVLFVGWSVHEALSSLGQTLGDYGSAYFP
jgi:hypothetical protein